jgi:hypothetical protein
MKTNIREPNKTMHHEVCRLADGRKAFLRSTPKALTPFGGLVVLIEFFRQLDLPATLRSLMPFDYQSPNAHGPVNILMGFWLGVMVGARRFAHVNLLRADTALRELPGWKRWPGDDATRAFFGRFGWGQIDAFFPPLTAWLLGKLTPQSASLDLDSTVFERHGQQQGAKKGYNPRKPGRPSHHPLLAVLAEPAFVLHGWLRSGNTTAGRGVRAFLTEAPGLLPEGWRIRCVRADSGFFDGALLDFLEAAKLPCIIVARMTRSLKLHCAGVRAWRDLDGNYPVGEFSAQLPGWSCERRFIVVRERVGENKRALGRKLIDVPGYTCRVFVTSCEGAPEALWRDYNQRACVEQRICEIKEDLSADGFCRREFFATEAAFRSVLLLFNLLSVWQVAAHGEGIAHQRASTLRMDIFVCGAVAGRAGHTFVLHMSLSWGGLESRKPFMEKTKQWCDSIAPRLAQANAPPAQNPQPKPQF